MTKKVAIKASGVIYPLLQSRKNIVNALRPFFDEYDRYGETLVGMVCLEVFDHLMALQKDGIIEVAEVSV